ncbi:MAG TPA: hypothetical protein VNA57_07880 [Acidimicrobiales bacterium]|nr:hypothetical protein [Acidimicrobiales bacterium]
MSSRTRFRRAPGHIRRLALIVFAIIAVAAATPGTATAQDGPGGIGLRLVEAPVAAKDDPRARIYIVDHLAPGAVIERGVEMSNSTSSNHQVSLYPSAATIEDGVFVGAEGNTANDLSRWTTVTPGTVDIAAGDKLTAVVRIAVPDDAAPGEQYGVVWAETRSDPATGGVTQVSRVGIRLYVSVGPGGAPAPDFTVEALTPGRSAQGEPMVAATVRNTGGRALDVTGTLMMSNGPGGLSAGPFPAELNTTLAVGDTQKITITLDERLPAGPWDAVVALQSGVTERRGQATITFPAAGEAAAVVTSTDSNRAWPFIGGTAAAGLVLGLTGVRHARRVRRRRITSRPAVFPV